MPVNLEIIFCFRDRDVHRIRNALQSLKEQTDNVFSVLFVDYGSAPSTAEKVRAICGNFTFCRYVYVDTRGKMWSRADALNYGIRLSDSPILFMADADLLFLPPFVETAKKIASSKPVYFPVGYLNESETKKASRLPASNLVYRKSEPFAQGMLAARKETFTEVNGYNNFYSLWGLEDNDIFFRLAQVGQEPVQADGLYILHQYHPPVSAQLPEGWVQLMKDYFEHFKQSRSVFNGLNTTKWPLSRPAYDLKNSESEMLRGRELFIAYFLRKAWTELPPGGHFHFEIPTTEIPPSKLKSVSRTIDNVFRKLNVPLQTSLLYAGQYPGYTAILHRLYFFVKSVGNDLADYYIESGPNSIRFIAVKK